MSYPVLIGEMAKRKITRELLSDTLNIHRNTVSYKLDKGSFSIEEAEKIHSKFFFDYSMSELFKRID